MRRLNAIVGWVLLSCVSANSAAASYFDDIYFGSVQVHLNKAPGKCIAFDGSEWSEDPSTLSEVLKRGQRQVGPGSSEADIVIPAIPALDFVCTRDGGPSQSLFPRGLEAPLIKVPAGSESLEDVHAVASGARSALMKRSDGWYRLKGCGNFDQGFPVRVNKVKTGSKPWRDIRGSAFPHTALRELNLAYRLNSLVESDGILSCNTPVSMALYDSPNLPLGEEFPTACVVEKTLGDRRFGTHVLAGLELLMPELVDQKLGTYENLLSAFPKTRPLVSKTGSVISTGELMSDFALGTSMIGNASGPKGYTWPDLARDETTLANMTVGFSKISAKTPDSQIYPQQWTRAGAKEMSPYWKSAWDQSLNELKEALGNVESKTPMSAVLAYLYSRAGYDAGRIMGAMHKNRISWGTYQDEMCRRDMDEWHCNAHANNLVLVPEGAIPAGKPGAESLLSFLDLDMAFDEKSYVDMDKRTIGMSREDFDHLLWREHVYLMEVLAGSDSSNGVPKVALTQVQDQVPEVHAVKAALYDTLILSYLRGYSGENRFPVMKYDPALHKAAHALLRLAIIVMADYVA